MTDTITPDRRPMLGYRELADYLGIGVRTCKRWVAEGEIPAPDLRLRGVVRWHPDTIDRWLVRHRREQT